VYEQRKEVDGYFSYRFFSGKAGFRSPNFLKLVIDGKRNLSPDSVEKFVRALKLNRREADFFRILVHLNQARTVDEKRIYVEQIMRFQPVRYIHPLRQEQYEYYSQWYNIAIREAVGLPDFVEDPAWIARKLVPPISPGQARKALDLLLRLGLLRREESGRLVQTDAFITTGDEVTSTSVANYHREMMRKGSEAIDLFPPADRDISSVTMSLSIEKFREITQL